MSDAPATFAALDLPAPLLRAVDELGFPTLTPVQARALPPLLAGRDLVGRARTGSGKTVAFGLPLLTRVDLGRRRPQALVLCPTRELGAQVATTLRTLGRHLPGLRVLLVSGGQPGGPQRRALEEGVHVLVGTPGRVRDHLDRGAFDPRHLRVAVLDEADRMLDMGFAPDVEQILAALPAERQTMFFSATFPRSIADMSEAWQRDPVHVVVEETAEAPATLRQVACAVEDKPAALLALCRAHPGPTLVFANLKATAAALAEDLRRAGVAAAYIGGDLEQRDRDRVLAMLRNKSLAALVATDVAARGLDVDELALVVNVDLPGAPESYVHRVGRTGRAGRAGLAVALAAPREEGKLRRYEAFSGLPIERLSLDDLLSSIPSLLGQGGFAPPQRPPDAPAGPVAPMVTLRIGGGRKDKLRPGDILGALTGDVGLPAADVGRIEIHDHLAYVAVARDAADRAYEALASGRIKGRRFRVERLG